MDATAGQQLTRNIVQGSNMLHLLYGTTTMLALDAYSLKPVKLLVQQVPTFLLFCDRQLKCSATLLHPFAWNHNNVGLVNMFAHVHCKDYCQ